MSSSSFSADETPPTADSCQVLHDKVKRCHARHGVRDPRCVMAQLFEKRCWSFVHCPAAAVLYYGTPHDGTKALCAAAQEAHVFADPRVMKIDSPDATKRKNQIFEHHQRAMYRVRGNLQKRQQCAEYTQALHKCLAKHCKQANSS